MFIFKYTYLLNSCGHSMVFHNIQYGCKINANLKMNKNIIEIFESKFKR